MTPVSDERLAQLVREHLETRAEIVGLEVNAALKVRKLWMELYGVEQDEVVYGISQPPISLDEELAEAKAVFELQELNHKIDREKLEAKLQAQLDWRKQAIQGWSRENDEIEQILGKVLGYPWYKDDLKNFPDATEADGVCVGEHVPATLAAEAANKIKALQDKLKATKEAIVKAKDQETELYVENGRLRVLLRKASNYHLSSWSTEKHQADSLLRLLNDIDAEIGPPRTTQMTTDWIARACQEAMDKKLVPSDAHAEALKLVMREHYRSHIREINKELMGMFGPSKIDRSGGEVHAG